MQTRITAEEMQAAARQLAKSERGRTGMKRLLQMLENGGVDLDFLDQRAFLALLGGTWTGQSEKAQEAIRAALAGEKQES